MAATRTVDDRIDHWLRIIPREVRALPGVERHWGEARVLGVQSEDEILADRVGFRMEWVDLMDRLEHGLHRPYVARRMSPEQVARYHALLSLLREMAPIIERLGLSRPPRSVLETPGVA